MYSHIHPFEIAPCSELQPTRSSPSLFRSHLLLPRYLHRSYNASSSIACRSSVDQQTPEQTDSVTTNTQEAEGVARASQTLLQQQQAISSSSTSTSSSRSNSLNSNSRPGANQQRKPLLLNASGRERLRRITLSLAALLNQTNGFNTDDASLAQRIQSLLDVDNNSSHTDNSSASRSNVEHRHGIAKESHTSLTAEQQLQQLLSSTLSTTAAEASSSSASVADSIYASELAAILDHAQQMKESATDTDNDTTDDSSSTATGGSEEDGETTTSNSSNSTGGGSEGGFDANWLEGEIVQTLLLSRIIQLVGCDKALAFYTLAHTHNILSHTTTSPLLLTRLIVQISRYQQQPAAATHRLLHHATTANIPLTKQHMSSIVWACARIGKPKLVTQLAAAAEAAGVPFDMKQKDLAIVYGNVIQGNIGAAIKQFAQLEGESRTQDLYMVLTRGVCSSSSSCKNGGGGAGESSRKKNVEMYLPVLFEIAEKDEYPKRVLCTQFLSALALAADMEAINIVKQEILNKKISLAIQNVVACIAISKSPVIKQYTFALFQELRRNNLIEQLQYIQTTLPLLTTSTTQSEPPPEDLSAAFNRVLGSYKRLCSHLHGADLLNESLVAFDIVYSDVSGFKHIKAVENNAASLIKFAGAWIVERLSETGNPLKAYEIYAVMKASAASRPLVSNYGAIALASALTATVGGRQHWGKVLEIIHDTHAAWQPYTPSRPATRQQTSIITTAGRNRWLKEAVAVYNLMVQDGVAPSTITWNALISACNRSNNPEVGLQARAAMTTMEIPKDEKTFSSLLLCCGALEDKQRAHSLLWELWNEMLAMSIEPDSVCRNTMLWCLLTVHQPQEAIDLYHKWMVETEEIKNPRTGIKSAHESQECSYLELCRELGRQGKWARSQEALQYAEWMRRRGVDPAVVTKTELARLAEENKPPVVEELEQQQPEQTTTAITSAVTTTTSTTRVTTGSTDNSTTTTTPKAPIGEPRWQWALNLVEDIATHRKISYFEPDSVSRCLLLRAYGAAGQPSLALNMANELADKPVKPLPEEYHAAMDACASVGAADAALRLLQRMGEDRLRRSVVSYSTAMAACTNADKVDLIENLWFALKNEGIRPNAFVAGCLAKACSHPRAPLSLIQLAIPVFLNHLDTIDWGREEPMLPDAIMFSSLLEGVTRLGMWNDAARLLQIMEMYRPQSSVTLKAHLPPIPGNASGGSDSNGTRYSRDMVIAKGKNGVAGVVGGGSGNNRNVVLSRPTIANRPKTAPTGTAAVGSRSSSSSTAPTKSVDKGNNANPNNNGGSSGIHNKPRYPGKIQHSTTTTATPPNSNTSFIGSSTNIIYEGHWDSGSGFPLMLDLHRKSVACGTIATRTWLLIIKRWAKRGYYAPANALFEIVTGRGKNSPDGVSKLRPEVLHLLRKGMGRSASVFVPTTNTGVCIIEASKMYKWLLGENNTGKGAANLGFGNDDAEDALFQELVAKSRAVSESSGDAGLFVLRGGVVNSDSE